MNETGKQTLGRELTVVLVVAGLAFVLGMNLFLFFGGDFGGGSEAPEFRLPVMGTSDEVALSDYRGQVVLIDFWATWCPPCRDQMPELKKLSMDPKYEGDLVILSINTDDYGEGREARIEAFLESVDLAGMPTLVDDGRVRGLYGVRSIPTLVVVNREGRIVHSSAGLHDEEMLRRILRRRADL